MEVALSSSMRDVGNWSGGGGGTGTFTTSADAFSGIGSAEYLQTDPATGQVLLSVKDVLTADEVLEYQQWEDFPSESPGMFDGAEWRTDWSDTVTELHDSKGHTVIDEKTGDKHMHGSWSGIYHRTTEIMESPEFSKTGVEVWNGSLASRPSHAPDVMEGGGRIWGGETYHFTDAEEPDGNGIQIYSAEFDSMRPLWQTIVVPEAMKVHYPPTPGPFIAAATSDGKYGKYENRLAFWLKTSDRSEATETIKRNYWKVTTRDSDRSHPVIESTPVTISKGAKTSAIVSLQAEAGTNVSLQTVEFQTNDITKGLALPVS